MLSIKSTPSLKAKVFFRADGNSEKGLGHIVRCLSVIEMLKETFDCSMIVNNTDETVLDFIRQTCSVTDIKAQSTTEELSALRKLVNDNDIFVIDGYSFDEIYQLAVKEMVMKMVAIDDLADKKFETDVIINHGDIEALPPYRMPASAKLYAGFDYMVVRPEFLKAAKIGKKITFIDTVFICMGGTDPFDITVKVLEACIQCDFIKKVNVVTGSLYQNRNGLHALIALSGRTIIENIENANAAQMVSLIEESQVAISTASSISLEICCVKAALLCGTVIDNQYSIHSQLIRNECCVSIGDWRSASVSNIKNQLEAINDVTLAQKIVDKQGICADGESGERIREIFNELAA